MSLRFKFFISFLALGLIPIIIAGMFNFSAAREQISKRLTNRLHAIAEIHEKQMHSVLQQYIQEAKQVSNDEIVDFFFRQQRTREQTVEALQRKVDLIEDIQDIQLFDTDGNLLISTAAYPVSIAKEYVQSYQAGEKSFTVQPLFRDEQNSLRIRVQGPVYVEEVFVGIIDIVFHVDALLRIVTDYAGLEQSGEILIAQPTEQGSALIILPRRFDTHAALTQEIIGNEKTSPIIAAVQGREGGFNSKYARDDQGRPVFAATRFVDAFGWGMAVQMLQEEGYVPTFVLLQAFITIGFISLSLIFLLSFFVTRSIVNPIEALATFAKKLEKGMFSSRTSIQTGGEIGMFAKVMNSMATQLEKRYEDLEEEVKQRNQELLQLNNRFQLAKESAHIGVFDWDIQKNILLWDEEMYRIYGVKKEDFSGAFEAWEHCVIKEDLAAANKAVQETLKGTYPLDTFFRVRFSSGEIRYIKAFGLVERDEQGTPLRLIGMNWDITAEKELDQAKTDFVSLASHQLRNPLTAIKWSLESLRIEDQTHWTEQQRYFLKEVYANTERMIQLVRELLDISQIEMGMVKEKKGEDISLVCLIEDSLKSLGHLIEQKALTVEVCNELKEESCSTNKYMMRLVIDNLISNAVKYSYEQGSISIRLLKKNHTLSFSVKDTGCGIPKKQHGKIFQKLFRADNAMKYDVEGNGLGLYAVYTLVTQLGGKIWFESKEQKGSTFFVELPCDGGKE